MLDEGRDVDRPAELLMLERLFSEELEQTEITEDLLFRPRPLDFDHNVAAVFERRAMHLSDRSCGEGLRLDRGEDVFPWHPQLLLHDAHDLRLRERFDAVLQLLELVHELFRQQIGPCRKDLAELRKRRPQLLQRCAHPLGTFG